MAHFAKLGINSKVIGVEVVADDDCCGNQYGNYDVFNAKGVTVYLIGEFDKIQY